MKGAGLNGGGISSHMCEMVQVKKMLESGFLREG